MAHSNSTTNYSLPQFVSADKPAWLTDVNTAYADIDTGMHNAQVAADNAQSDATQALTDASTAATTATGADAKASGAVASISESFDTTATYSVGDYVIYNNLLYRCTVDVVTPGSWTGSANWERTTIDAIVSDLASRTGSDIAVSDTDADSIASKIAPLSAFIATPLFKRLTCNNITKTLPANGSVSILGTDLTFSESIAGYTPVAICALYSTAQGYFATFDARTTGASGTFAIIRSTSGSSQNVISNFTVLFARNDLL